MSEHFFSLFQISRAKSAHLKYSFLSPLQATHEVEMFTGMISKWAPLILRHSEDPGNLSTEGMGSVIEQNEEFAKWWEQRMGRVQGSRVNARKFTLTPTDAQKEHR